jgi:hypothetical protein
MSLPGKRFGFIPARADEVLLSGDYIRILTHNSRACHVPQRRFQEGIITECSHKPNPQTYILADYKG